MTGTYRNFGLGLDHSQVTSVIGFDYKDRSVSSYWIRVDYDFLATMDIPLLAGRDFSPAFPSDSAQSVIINEAWPGNWAKKSLLAPCCR